jgi:hypothetical protein
VTLATYTEAEELYLARGEEVNPNRPLFTGDIVADVPVPGVQDGGPAIVIAHPCSIRGSSGSLLDRTLMGAVARHHRVSRQQWGDGFFDRMPLPDLPHLGYCVAWLDRIGRAETALITRSSRLACLSEFGINMLQQRLVCHLTRAEIATFQFHEAFAHTMIEADLLEEWNDSLIAAGYPIEEATARFEEFIRSGTPSHQEQLLDPQRRASVRVATTRMARLIITGRG